MIWLTLAYAQVRPAACIGAPALPPGDALDDWIAQSSGRAVVDLQPGVYSVDATLAHLDALVICGSVAGVVLTSDQPLGALRGSVSDLVLWNVALTNSSGPALDLVLVPGGVGVRLERVTATVGGVTPAVRVVGSGTLAIDDAVFTGGTSFSGTHLRLLGGTLGLEATITGSTFLDGTATGAGGSIFTSEDTTLTLIASDFVGNRADSGGAVHASGPLSITGGRFVGNAADCQGVCGPGAGQGGAVLAREGATTVAGMAVFEDNRAERVGGAVAVLQPSEAHIRDLTLCRNEAGEDGGGLYLEASEPMRVGALRVIENRASRGGGLFGPIEVESSNLLGNQAALAGSALATDGQPGVVNRSIVAFNRGAAWTDESVVDVRSTTRWRNAGPDVDEGEARDPAFRGYQPGVGDCSSVYDYVSAASAALVKTGDGLDLETPTWGTCPEPEATDRTCEPASVLWGAYGLYAEEAGLAGTTNQLPAWTDADGDGWPALFDCADQDPSQNPRTVYEQAGGFDTDCDGVVDLDFDGDGWAPPDDCDDEDPEVNPDAVDDDDTRDLDCDGRYEDAVVSYDPEPPFARGCGERDTDTPGTPMIVGGLLLPLFWRRRSD